MSTLEYRFVDMYKKTILLTLIMGICFNLKGQQQAQTLITKSGILQYLISLPEGYSDETNSKKWPILFFLHGAGERGSDLEVVKVHGPPKLVEAGQKFPFIVVSPQCEENDRWASSKYLDMLDALFAELKSNYNIDFNRVYLTGLSMGGQGTWEWAKKQPKRFAAIVPICGYSDANKVKKIRKMPIWVFHGAKDTIVPIEESNQIVALLKDYKSQVKFTVYPEANHDSWTETYNNPKLFSWILSQKKN